ncbi:MAG: SGNH/GDSL hydrolase family protein [Rhizobiaceae bacterium]|nr:SGNH/GDSL hydrolase family protein [Rhizobiaceae bacterium]
MKTILCYGDSLTWGYNAETLSRHAFEDRWPSVLQKELGDGYCTIAEGLNGRTTAFDDNLAGEDRNGVRLLPTLLGTHSPLDLVIFLLGTNDMKPWVHGNPLAAGHGVKRLVQIVKRHPYPFDVQAPKILLVAPPPVSRTQNAEFAEMFAGANEASRKLASIYRRVATEVGCEFFDAGMVAETSAIDGVHLDAENTRAIGAALAPVARKIIQGE